MDRLAIEDFFAGFGAVQARPMFGGHGVYRDGLFFAIVSDGEFYLKVDALTRSRFEAAGSRPFIYQGKNKPAQMSYWRVPDQALDDESALREWCDLALQAARRAHAQKAARATKER